MPILHEVDVYLAVTSVRAARERRLTRQLGDDDAREQLGKRA